MKASYLLLPEILLWLFICFFDGRHVRYVGVRLGSSYYKRLTYETHSADKEYNDILTISSLKFHALVNGFKNSLLPLMKPFETFMEGIERVTDQSMEWDNTRLRVHTDVNWKSFNDYLRLKKYLTYLVWILFNRWDFHDWFQNPFLIYDFNFVVTSAYARL